MARKKKETQELLENDVVEQEVQNVGEDLAENIEQPLDNAQSADEVSEPTLPIQELTDDTASEESAVELDNQEGENADVQEQSEDACDTEQAEGENQVLENAAPQSEPVEHKKKKRRKRRRINEITFENDIRYRGPFSYRWLRIFAWTAIVMAQAALILSLGAKVDASIAKKYSGLTQFLSLMGTLSVPFFLMANFAIIINAKNGYKRLIIGYIGLVLIIFALFVLVYQRYLLGIMNMVAKEMEMSSTEAFNLVFFALSRSGYLSFNIFVDLLLCTLFIYFVNYNPKRVFVGKKLIIFRLFALLPVAYEIACFVLKVLCVTNTEFQLPIYIFPFMTTKPPITFLVFIGLAIFIKNRERLFLKRGKTHEEYQAFLKTNLNSLHFSIAASIMLAIAAIIDIVLYFVIGAALTPDVAAGTDEEMVEALYVGMSLASELGFGKSIPLLLVIPFMLLFSYTRTHKPSSIDMLIPDIGVLAFVICYAEGFYQFVLRLPQILSKAIGS